MSSVTLGWDSDPDAINGYNVYRGTTSGHETTLLNGSPLFVLTFTDTSPLPGPNYYIVMAIGSGGVLSPASNEVLFTLSAGVATIQGQGSLSATIHGTPASSALIVGTGSLSGTMINTSGSASILGVGSLTGTIIGASAAASIAGIGSVSANLVTRSSPASIIGVGSVVANIISNNPNISGSIFGVGSLSASIVNENLQAVLFGSAALFGTIIGGGGATSGSILGSGSVFANATSGFVNHPNPTGFVLKDFGVTVNNPASVQTTTNALQLFYQNSFLPGTPGNAGTVVLPPWSAPGTADGYGIQGRTQMPGLLLLAPGNGSLSGKIYNVVLSGTVIIPTTAIGATFNLVMNQNYFAFGKPIVSDALFSLANPISVIAGTYSWALVCTLAGNGVGNGALSSAGILYVNGNQYVGSGFSNRLINREPIIQLSFGVQFGGSSGSGFGAGQFQGTLTQFQIQQRNN